MEVDEVRGDIYTPYEPENIPLKTILARNIEKRKPEEIITEGESKVVDRQTWNTGETTVHLKMGHTVK